MGHAKFTSYYPDEPSGLGGGWGSAYPNPRGSFKVFNGSAAVSEDPSERAVPIGSIIQVNGQLYYVHDTGNWVKSGQIDLLSKSGAIHNVTNYSDFEVVGHGPQDWAALTAPNSTPPTDRSPGLYPSYIPPTANEGGNLGDYRSTGDLYRPYQALPGSDIALGSDLNSEVYSGNTPNYEPFNWDYSGTGQTGFDQSQNESPFSANIDLQPQPNGNFNQPYEQNNQFDSSLGSDLNSGVYSGNTPDYGNEFQWDYRGAGTGYDSSANPPETPSYTPFYDFGDNAEPESQTPSYTPFYDFQDNNYTHEDASPSEGGTDIRDFGGDTSLGQDVQPYHDYETTPISMPYFNQEAWDSGRGGYNSEGQWENYDTSGWNQPSSNNWAANASSNPSWSNNASSQPFDPASLLNDYTPYSDDPRSWADPINGSSTPWYPQSANAIAGQSINDWARYGTSVTIPALTDVGWNEDMPLFGQLGAIAGGGGGGLDFGNFGHPGNLRLR